MQVKKKTIPWHNADHKLGGLATNAEHDISVQREAIPLVFVPGIMGSRLRRAQAPKPGDPDAGLPNLRWSPGDPTWMGKNYMYRYASRRKRMLLGSEFSPAYLEVANSHPVGDGFEGIMEDYRPFLERLRDSDWAGPLKKLLVFPVYAFGYNWTDDNRNSGAALARRIKDIIKEAKEVVGVCEKVILVTHSMGGLVARAASQLSGAEGSILGIVHGVQPVTGASAAYWRMKAGFEIGDNTGTGVGQKIKEHYKAKGASASLGNDAKDVTPLLGNSPGGLELLPNKQYITNAGNKPWLTVTEDGKTVLALPTADPYQEIYRVKAVVTFDKKVKPSNNAYWGLVDPTLLDPDDAAPSDQAQESPDDADAGAPDGDAPDAGDSPNAIDAKVPTLDSWGQYLRMLAIAESFHTDLGLKQHAKTFCFRGTIFSTTDVVELRVESNWVTVRNYPTRGFKGFFQDKDGKRKMAVLQSPAGLGDGTVPLASAGMLFKKGRPAPGDWENPLQHQPAYENPAAQTYTIKAILALCKQHYASKR